ncbi:SDR family NAD(P)-dependent oxidoreductase [Streptomyces sp. V4I2]|uniref:SDR family NAD(P)-dependent oxidoreductase n=1 Tax=Streptomyces sp. V4I2 TaxID=3042280 RepID=UPI00277DF57C|nr:SDR family NAD(P)-dependent oxidoreductase [Streptomyces sp. V4I2]MDQ1042399.1 hypothetical protein [Streptomyces sp. V4I2]
MRRRRKGAIVNFSSIGGLRAFPSVGYYNATKFAVEGLSEALWQEIEPLGLRVLLVEPGPFRTDWTGRSATETLPGHEIADYAPTAGAQQAGLRAGTGKEPGDPARAAAIITAVEADNPPHRLLLGGLAHCLALDKLDQLRTEFTSLGIPLPLGRLPRRRVTTAGSHAPRQTRPVPTARICNTHPAHSSAVTAALMRRRAGGAESRRGAEGRYEASEG